MIGRLLAHYQITGPLGKGRMGEIFRAHDPRLNRDVATKVLSGEIADNAASLARST